VNHSAGACRSTRTGGSSRSASPTLANPFGAYLSPLGSFIPTRSTDLVVGLYRTPAIHINVKGICTNTVPV